VLYATVLDRIDQLAQPGVNLNPTDTGYGEQVLEPLSAEANAKQPKCSLSEAASGPERPIGRIRRRRLHRHRRRARRRLQLPATTVRWRLIRQ